MLFSKEIGDLLESQKGAKPPQTSINLRRGIRFYDLELHSGLSRISGPANCLDVVSSAADPVVIFGKKLLRLRLTQVLNPNGSIAEELLSNIGKGIDGSTVSTTYMGINGENPRTKTVTFEVGSLYHWGKRLRGKKPTHEGPYVVYYSETIKPDDVWRISQSMCVIADAVRNSSDRKKIVNF